MGANTSWRTGLVLFLLSRAAVGQSLPNTTVSIVVYDDARVGAKTLDRAERLAGKILLKAGIPSSWDAGPVDELRNLGTDFSAFPRTACQTEVVSTVLRMQILAHAPAGLAPHALGFSLPCARRGVQVVIYADRVARVSETEAPTFGRVLAFVMAHELGHVLLHSSDHEATGLMKDVWSKSDWQRAAVSIISFSPADMEQFAALQQRVTDRDLPQSASLHVR
jgi:hypothetical protein